MTILRFSIAYPPYFSGLFGDAEASPEAMGALAVDQDHAPFNQMAFAFEGRRDEEVWPWINLTLERRSVQNEWGNWVLDPIQHWEWYVDPNVSDPNSATFAVSEVSVSSAYVDGVFQYEANVPDEVLAVLTQCDSVTYTSNIPGQTIQFRGESGVNYIHRAAGDIEAAFWIDMVEPYAQLADSGLSDVDPRDSRFRITPLSWGVELFWTNKTLCVETLESELKRVPKLTTIPGVDPVLPKERLYKWALYEYSGVIDTKYDIHNISEARRIAESVLIPDDQLTLEQVAMVASAHANPAPDCVGMVQGLTAGQPAKPPAPPPPAPSVPNTPPSVPNIPMPPIPSPSPGGFGAFGQVGAGGSSGGGGYILTKDPVTGADVYQFYDYKPTQGADYYGTFDFLVR